MSGKVLGDELNSLPLLGLRGDASVAMDIFPLMVNI